MSIWQKLYNGETDIDFIGRTKRWMIISLVVIAIGLVSLATRGLHLGIEFKGGVVWEVPAGKASVASARDAVNGAGVHDATVQTLRDAKGDERIRVSAKPVATKTAQSVSDALAKVSGSKVDDVSLNSVGPTWGDEISRKALRALVFFLIAITIYITLRFEFRMAVPTLIALVHDVLITVGIYSVAGFEVTPGTVIALLTILGYSIYDGIVVFDKVDENTKLVSATNGISYGDMVNTSLNQVLMRSLNTSITALIPVGSLLVLGSFILGARSLEDFALALLIGLFAGAYSSIFIASPLLAVFKEREPRYREIRKRIGTRAEGRVRAAASRPAATATGDPVSVSVGGGAEPAVAAPGTTGPSGRVIPPRPRKKGRRR